jgi:hypothetical protein
VINTSTQALWISVNLLFITLALIRLSILAFYRRLFGVSSMFSKMVIAFRIVNLMWALGSVLGSIFICKPVSHYWDPLASGVCVEPLRYLLIISILDIFWDFSLMLLPIPRLAKLNVLVRTRLAIIAPFCIEILYVVSPYCELKVSMLIAQASLCPML